MRRRCGRDRGVGQASTQSFGCGLFCLATNEIAQTGLSSLPPVIYYSEQLFRETIRRKLLERCNIYAILTSTYGFFYAQGVKMKVVFFDTKPKDGKIYTKGIWL